MKEILYIDSNIFNRCGLAALSDLKNQEWMELFALLEKEQALFLQNETKFRSSEYKWPKDPLHTWSRLWEYPYVYYHIKQLKGRFKEGELPIVIDFGSGVTFFPFSIARLGYHVICIDNDPICQKDMLRAIDCFPCPPGKVEFEINFNNKILIDAEKVDIVYCISVLEHIVHLEEVINEIARILKPAGICIVTIDLDLRGDQNMGIERYKQLRKLLFEYFENLYPEITIHPMDILNSLNSPYSVSKPTGLRLIHFILKQYLAKPLIGRKPSPILPLQLSLAGWVMRKRS